MIPFQVVKWHDIDNRVDVAVADETSFANLLGAGYARGDIRTECELTLSIRGV